MFEGIHLEQLVITLVVGVLVIATVSALAPRVGVAGPLVLVALGIGFSLLPFTDNLMLDPEWILLCILPPLLYAAAVSLPAMEFRRDFGTIGGLSVVLVLLSSLVLGLVFMLIIPGVGLALGIALGAVLSPTDAVATSIVKRLGISPRIVTVLEGESLLNDATALVLLKTAVIAIAGGFSFWGSLGTFSVAVIIAIVVGGAVGWLNLHVRAWIPNTTAATAMGFVVPYVAYLPSEHLGGSGLVAAVVAGIVTGQGSARFFTAEQRLSDSVNWRTIELMLEGAVFLIMGLEVTAIIQDTPEGWGALPHAAGIAGIAVAIILVMRTLYIIPIVWLQSRRVRRGETVRPRLENMQERIDNLPNEALAAKLPGNRNPERVASRFRKRIARTLNDITYIEAERFGPREGTIIVWAGMRGAVTLAAAQTLPEGPTRSFLILIAFLVAVGTLLLQGSTIGPLTKKLGLAASDENNPRADQLAALNAQLREAAALALENPDLAQEDGRPFDPDVVRVAHARLSIPLDEDHSARAQELRDLRLITIQAQRTKLSFARSNGNFSTAVLRQALESLDAEELSIRTHMHE